MELRTEVFQVEGVPIVHLTGEVDTKTSGVMRDAVLSLMEEGAKEVVINLDGVEYIDSSGLGALVGLLKTAKDRGRNLCLASANPLVDHIMGITGLRAIFCLEQTDAQAVQALHSAVGSPAS